MWAPTHLNHTPHTHTHTHTHTLQCCGCVLHTKIITNTHLSKQPAAARRCDHTPMTRRRQWRRLICKKKFPQNGTSSRRFSPRMCGEASAKWARKSEKWRRGGWKKTWVREYSCKYKSQTFVGSRFLNVKIFCFLWHFWEKIKSLWVLDGWSPLSLSFVLFSLLPLL